MIHTIDKFDYDTQRVDSSRYKEPVQMLPLTIENMDLLLNKINELVEKVNKLEEKLEFLDKIDI
jgi:hypothetical protein